MSVYKFTVQCRIFMAPILVWFSALQGMKEEQNVFLTHGWSLNMSVLGVSGHKTCVRFRFCHLALPDMPHSPTHEVFFECVN